MTAPPVRQVRSKTAPTREPGAGEQGRTTPAREQHAEPRLPHERDESTDSQTRPPIPDNDIPKQAYEDARRGLPDTDRGPAMDRTYRQVKDQPAEGAGKRNVPRKGGREH